MIPPPMPILYLLAIVLLMNLGSHWTGDGTAFAVTWCAAFLFAAFATQGDPKG